MGQWAQLIGTILGSAAIGGIITAIVQGWFQRKKTNAEAGSIETDSDLRFAVNLQTYTDKLMNEVTVLSQDKHKLLVDNGTLQAQLRMTEATKSILESDLHNTLREVGQIKKRVDEIEISIKSRLNGPTSKH